jgi:hypothetical protein
MAVHQNKNDLSVEATQECLDSAALLLTTEKQDGGIMGYGYYCALRMSRAQC